jgi:hypothetical protein
MYWFIELRRAVSTAGAIAMGRLDVTDLGGSDSRAGGLRYLISGTGGGWRVEGVDGSGPLIPVPKEAQPSTSHGDADPKQNFNMMYIMNSNM